MASDIAQWLNVAAQEKAESVLRLAPPGVSTVIEIGCGTGAVLEALDRRGFGDEYWACEPAEALLAQVPQDRIARLQETQAVTFDAAFLGQTFDLAILTHVVEHLLAPSQLVHEALKRARHVFVEVPIEANVAGRARSAVRRSLGRDPLKHPAGHVQFFSRVTARLVVNYAGGVVVADRGYFPRAPYASQADRPYQRAVLAASRLAPVVQRYYEHFAMLARPATVESWDHHYARPE